MTKACRKCLSLVCIFCNRLKTEQGLDLNIKHCDRHCKAKAARKRLAVVAGIDRRRY